MRAWVVDHPERVEGSPLRSVTRPIPEAGDREVRVRVVASGVCRTDLHLAEGDLAPKHFLVTPGHEIVGVIDARGPGADRFSVGDRVGIAWLAQTCGLCRFCARGDENLCLAPSFTGWDRDGGFAEFATAHEDFVYSLPDGYDDVHAAPLLCSGIIGYRALRRARVSRGGRLGIYGFGASAHITAQLARAEGIRVHVMTRSEPARRLALELGCSSAGGASDEPPEPLDGAVLFAPVGTLVPTALAALDRGGTLAIAGIHLSDIPALNYQRHLFQERTVTSTTANTRRDGEEFLALAARIPLRVEATEYPLDAADQALRDLAADRVVGAAVLRVAEGDRPTPSHDSR
ncbi:MAG: zinc-dependent alcohol dehydrogenase family protein [Acidimicrobiia bacterium]|nr:zinc-dependent alcohol dehydrogenase family protein [Acidimicrobiia bacterium]